MGAFTMCVIYLHIFGESNENCTATIFVSLCYIIYLGQVKITLLEAMSLGSLYYILRNNNYRNSIYFLTFNNIV